MHLSSTTINNYIKCVHLQETYFSLKCEKNTAIFKYCILTMRPSILINFRTLSKPTYCLSE